MERNINQYKRSSHLFYLVYVYKGCALRNGTVKIYFVKKSSVKTLRFSI